MPLRRQGPSPSAKRETRTACKSATRVWAPAFAVALSLDLREIRDPVHRIAEAGGTGKAAVLATGGNVTQEFLAALDDIRGSALAEAPCAPHTLEMLARFAVLSRLKPHANSRPFAKMRVYDGDNIRDRRIEGRDDRDRRCAGSPHSHSMVAGGFELMS